MASAQDARIECQCKVKFHDTYRNHLPLHSLCDVCGLFIDIGERFLAIQRERNPQPNGNHRFYIFGPKNFPRPGDQTCRRFWLCRKSFCVDCTHQLDTATLHFDCYRTYMQFNKDRVDRLSWLALLTTQRSPWHACPSLGIRPRMGLTKAIRHLSDFPDLTNMRTVPLEIAQMIHRFSEDAIFWRYAAASHLAQWVEYAAHYQRTVGVVSLTNIRSWSRFETPVSINAGNAGSTGSDVAFTGGHHHHLFFDIGAVGAAGNTGNAGNAGNAGNTGGNARDAGDAGGLVFNVGAAGAAGPSSQAGPSGQAGAVNRLPALNSLDLLEIMTQHQIPGVSLGGAQGLLAPPPPQNANPYPLVIDQADAFIDLVALAGFDAPDDEVDADAEAESIALAQEKARNPFYRITIDFRGIRKIERLPRRPETTSFTSKSLAYIVESESDLRGVRVEFQNGFPRLLPVKGQTKLEVWDRPNPPPFHTHFLAGLRTFVSEKWFRQMRTISPVNCTGLTFFLGQGAYGIHKHTPSDPTAEKTCRDLLYTGQEVAAWVYVPLARNDTLEAIGAENDWRYAGGRWRPRYMIRTQLCGDVSFGAWQNRPATIKSRVTPAGPALVFDVADVLTHVSLLGVESDDRNDAGFRRTGPLSDAPRIRDPLFSSAPLSNVTKVEIFYNEDTSFCRGIIFTYSNGGERAVGQCRLGVDPSRTCDNPRRLCISNREIWDGPPAPLTGQKSEYVRVEASCHPSHTHSEEGDGSSWECVPMNGCLEFWFDPRHHAKAHHIPEEELILMT